MPTAAVRSLDSINRVVQAFCSEGVPYKSVSEIAKVCRGQVMSKDFLRDNAGEYPVYSSQTENDGMLGKITTYMFDGEYLTWTTDGANAGTVFYRKGKFSVTNVCGVIDVTDETISTKYLFYVLNREAPQYVNKGMGNPKLMSNVMAKIRIPIPPLAVQQEIVRILDSFTELTTELNEKLTAELTARRKQYEHYRDELLTFGDDVPRISLGEVGPVCMCKRILKSQTNDIGGVPFYKIGTFGKEANAYISEDTYKEYRNKYNFPQKGDILISAAGTIGRTVVYDGKPAYFQDSNIVWIANDESKILKRFLIYCYAMKPWYISTGGTIARLYNDNILKARIPAPSLTQQAFIVDTLDRFDRICNNLTSGLPAEIAARQKQYKYFRNKLLTFKELEE